MIQVYESGDFGSLRTVEEDGKVMFCATDVAKALGYARPADAVKAHCRGSVNYRPITDSLGRIQQAKFISEPDVYRLITHSKLPNAERFEAWVFEEVLPSIRSHGGYLTQSKIEEALLDPDTIIKLATNLKAEREAHEQEATRLDIAVGRAHEAVMAANASEADKEPPEPETPPQKPSKRFLFRLEFEATEEDGIKVRDFMRNMPSLEGKLYKKVKEV